MKDWKESIIEVIGTLKTNEDGKIAMTPNKYHKYTVTLKVRESTELDILARKNTYVFVDGVREVDAGAFKKLEEKGVINGQTRIVATGHLVRTPGKPGMNDLFNLKTLGFRLAEEGETVEVDFDDALTKDEWAEIRQEHFASIATATVSPTAPTAPTAPVAPF